VRLRSGDPGLVARVRDHFDWTLFISVAALAVVGVINLYSATSVSHSTHADDYIQQIYWLVGGGILATMVAAIDYRHYERLGYALYGVGVVLLLLVFILGREIRGSSRWIYIGSYSFQPSEFMKLFLVIALAKYLHDDPRSEGRTLKDLVIPALLTGVPALLILQQPDLGTASILVLVFLTIAALTRIRWQSIVLVVASAVPAAYAFFTLSALGYQQARIKAFFNPEADIKGIGYHAHHARVAIGDGGLLGSGLGMGTQNRFGFIPDQYTDFPFPVFAEEWGFVGCVVLICLYGFVTVWSIHVASQAKDRFGAVLAVGGAAILFWHAVINMGMAAGLVPVVGVTLPLFSHGGSSMITMLGALSLVMNVSMRRYGGVPAPDRL
jgi:rod shape determining protein RodA